MCIDAKFPPIKVAFDADDTEPQVYIRFYDHTHKESIDIARTEDGAKLLTAELARLVVPELLKHYDARTGVGGDLLDIISALIPLLEDWDALLDASAARSPDRFVLDDSDDITDSAVVCAFDVRTAPTMIRLNISSVVVYLLPQIAWVLSSREASVTDEIRRLRASTEADA